MRRIVDSQFMATIPQALGPQIALVIDCELVGPLERKIHGTGELYFDRRRKQLVKKNIRMKAESVARRQQITGFG